MIKLKNVTKEFQVENIRQRVLENINLEIKNNEFITIMGPSGGGKSTLLQIIALLTDNTTGEIYFNDEKVSFKNEKKINSIRRDNISLVFQNPNLISSLNVIENIVIASNSKESYREKVKKGKELLDKVGLKDKYYAKVTSLSGGEAQRVSVVRAIINEPKLLLCDEPTGALDSTNSKNIIELLVEIKREIGCTLIIVTHDKNIGNLGEKKIFLKDGELYEMDKHL
ncbi:MAG: ABC transporter ATP-binding protein [Clostridium sp.]|uniref:ABC transporter ATP-binding protein n=1 Tax=Clostridium sp. TaxID=1506 RepID=UPI0030305543